ncbi:uncharacterized protein [Euphorbia lathyris]|uniref:uncharacterized protein n=1 Tax=Euphorbia lathyris TaxID=212925 RepID=UPI0033142246
MNVLVLLGLLFSLFQLLFISGVIGTPVFTLSASLHFWCYWDSSFHSFSFSAFIVRCRCSIHEREEYPLQMSISGCDGKDTASVRRATYPTLHVHSSFWMRRFRDGTLENYTKYH